MIITFIGHANLCITHQLKEQIRHTLETKICPHNTTFYCGGYGAFDNICAHIVNELKVAHPHIRAVFVSPYRNQARLQTAKESGLYDDICKNIVYLKFDNSTILNLLEQLKTVEIYEICKYNKKQKKD